MYHDVIVNRFNRSFMRSNGCQWSSFWSSATCSLLSWCSGVSASASLPYIHWLPPLCPLEVLPHPSAKETKVSESVDMMQY